MFTSKLVYKDLREFRLLFFTLLFVAVLETQIASKSYTGWVFPVFLPNDAGTFTPDAAAATSKYIFILIRSRSIWQ